MKASRFEGQELKGLSEGVVLPEGLRNRRITGFGGSGLGIGFRGFRRNRAREKTQQRR